MVLRSWGSLRAFALMLAPALLLSAAGVCNATIIASDDFEGGESGWSGSWNYNNPATAGESASAGAMVVNGNSPGYASRDLSSTVTSDFFFAFTMDTSSLVDSPNQIVQFYFDSDPTVAPGQNPYSFAPSIGLKVDKGGVGVADFEVRFGYSPQVYSDAVQINGVNAVDNVGIVGRLSKSNGTTYDTFDLWLTSDLAGFPNFGTLGPPQATAVSNSSLLSSVSEVGVFSSMLASGDTVLLDNVVMSTVPEPMTMALWGIGGVAGLVYSARRRRAAAAKA